MTARTYGTYRYLGPTPTISRARWVLEVEPAVRMRARRVFGRVQQTRSTWIQVFHSTEVCRDLQWFMDRFPLEPFDERSAEILATGATTHREQEQAIANILAGAQPRQLPQEPAKTPRDYQLTAVEMLRARLSLLLTDEVGLGKTFTGLLSAVHEDALPMLVVPPTHLPRRWVTELVDAFPWLTYHVATSTKPTAKVQSGQLPDVLIVSYSKLDGWAGHLAGRIRTVVFDEAQELRNGVGTLKGRAAAQVCEAATFRLGLTATPVYNYGGEIWNIYDILAPGELGTREEFLREWGASEIGHPKVKDPAALGAYLREQGLMLGRTRKEVGRELPKTVKVHQLVDSDYAALADVEDRAKEFARIVLSDTATPQEKMQAAGQIDWRLRHATGVDKAPYVADWVRMLLEAEQRVVLWGWHRDVYDIWMEALAEFNPVLYTGTESSKQKAAAEDAFTRPIDESNPLEQACRILIMSLRSGAGVDGLQEVCRVGVFGELDWSPQVHEQAIGRLRRDGMGDDPPVVYYLTSTEGSDPAILDVLQVKRNQSEPLVSPDGKLLANSTTDVSRGRKLAKQVLGLSTDQEAIA